MPSISVVIPVYDGARQLRACLQRLGESGYPALECIVVDDGSTDRSAEVAREFGAVVLSTEGRKGPAYARNLGARAARGDVLFFIDSDVCVCPDTLDRVARHFEEDPVLDAVIGSYDASPESADLLSQYKNLMHHSVHQHGREQARTFWSGCGAIRREVFQAHGGFDTSYRHPSIEDIELGYRMASEGRKILLDRKLQVKHLKRWTFWNLVKTDIFYRGIPWTELILRDHRMPNDLNLHLSQRLSVALSFLLFGLAIAGTIRYRGYFLTPVLALLCVVLARYWVEASTAPRHRGPLIGMAVLVGAFTWLAYAHRMLPMVPAVLLGYALLLLRHRYASRSRSRSFMSALVCWLYIAFVGLFSITFLPRRPLVFAFYIGLLTLVVLNNQFYVFLGGNRGWLSALAVVPFHLLYHFYNGISFGVGFLKHLWMRAFNRIRHSPIPVEAEKL